MEEGHDSGDGPESSVGLLYTPMPRDSDGNEDKI